MKIKKAHSFFFLFFIVSFILHSTKSIAQEGYFGAIGTITLTGPVSNEKTIDSLKWEEQKPFITKYDGKKIKQILYQRSTDRVFIFLKGSDIFQTDKQTAVANGIMAEPSSPKNYIPNNNYMPAHDPLRDTNRISVIYIYVDSPLYVGIINHVKPVNTDSNFKQISSWPKFAESFRSGEYEITPDAPGDAFLELYEKDNTKHHYEYVYTIKRLPSDTLEPEIILGKRGNASLTPELLKSQQEIKVTKGFTFVSAVVYFSGAGFTNIITSTLHGASLDSIRDFFDICSSGSIISFDNVKVQDSSGQEITIHGFSFKILNNGEKYSFETKPDDYSNDYTGQFPGGQNALNAYLTKSFRNQIASLVPYGHNECTLALKILPDGSVAPCGNKFLPKTNFEKQCFEMLQNGPTWTPQKYHGKAIATFTSQYISINL